MSGNLNAQLIEAVEAGSDADVKRLIEEGASRDTRKKVTLRAKVDDGRGGFDWKEDTVECETALLLAVLHARVKVVRVLLEKGASVAGEVEWKVGNSGNRSWTAQEWQRDRWRWTYRFPSVLAAAIGHGGKLTFWDGTKYDIPGSDGKLHISLRGGVVALNHPTTWQERSSGFFVQPDVAIVRLLLAYGARVTNTELEAARKNANPEFLRSLKSHSRNPIPRPGPLELELAATALAAQSREFAYLVTTVEMKVQSKEARNQAVSLQLSTFATNYSYFHGRSAALAKRLVSLQNRNAALTRILAGSSS
ncbi:hypothetical protein M427DRAFT_247105 [Gonapodya prolifera JEL478]|uniref:Uncharacterized protein n=1 Tax=Gonapodya prolifera (strain JEL478) TaxID=1344416 RepID=A0A139AM28_GONPJ|nr:hypothetical protein M427DRAFT_247105 [Gonapodya prolifera JEL478]|eukprot:KXS17840.1 hypothetical protein M427DRAFT_247105 [Gonapodya prolifera JEL478]